MTGEVRVPAGPRGLAPAHLSDEVVIAETRSEAKGSIVGWVTLTVVTVFLAVEFADRAEPVGYFLWLGTMAPLLTGWLIAWIRYLVRPPSDERLLARWVPGARLAMIVSNVAMAGSIWVFLPVSGPELRALIFVLAAWYLIVQFVVATDATQVVTSAVVLMLGSLTAWLLVERPPYFLPLSLFLPLFGVTLVAIRRLVRQAVVQEAAARAAADAARRELAAALTVIERERDAKTHFIRAASHDLQQPLQAAGLFLDRLKPSARAAEQAASIGGLRRSLTAARSLVGSMLEHLKLEGGVIQPNMITLEAGEVFDRVLLTQGPAAAGAGVRLSVVGHGVSLYADPALLARAVENLVANAIRHSGGRRILVGARARADNVEIWVVDDGRGLAADDEARIFSPFEQGVHVGAAGGFGLGLASTRGLADLMGGRCGVRRGLTRGAAFYIRLSAGRSERDHDASYAA